ncbi:hypothetical protein [Cellulomonas oligotrophica]|uniref:Uncharacterized protein n=1 Tax=Cellulomonas oligotrophica TaxID=931536 RepID=A0A7Y9FGC3_9CELL|nr:hypothetical protein [Cellulomonas oligotrophica]NYD86744.1 hypothetical protein [Cellulomonas oligotrophica]GIG32470.1 hypothetical protein Col01nite_16290 [Cellulomonas oligotrophica]
MAEHPERDARDAVRAAQDAWQCTEDTDPKVLAAVRDGLAGVPAGSPAVTRATWFGIPHQRGSRETKPSMRRRRRG